mgnify:FL=1
MLGIEDTSVFVGYVLSVLSAALCIVYGAVMWTGGGEKTPAGGKEDMHWVREEQRIEEDF